MAQRLHSPRQFSGSQDRRACLPVPYWGKMRCYETDDDFSDADVAFCAVSDGSDGHGGACTTDWHTGEERVDILYVRG